MQEKEDIYTNLHSVDMSLLEGNIPFERIEHFRCILVAAA